MDQVQQLQDLIAKIDGCEKTRQNIQWMKQICQKQYNMVNLLIQSFMMYIDNSQLANNILKALSKLNLYIPQEVLPQLQENKQFPILISQYLTKTDIKNKCGEGYYLLVQIYQSEGFKSVTSKQFVQTLMDDLEQINDNLIFNALVFILISISSEQPNIEQNIVLEICCQHPNERYLSESLSQILNNSDHQKVLKCLKFIEDVYKRNKQFFYSSDLEVVIGILVRESLNVGADELRLRYLQTLNTLIQTQEYKKKIFHLNDIKELCKEIKNNQVSLECQQTAVLILSNL